LLLGRRTFEMFAPAWSVRTAEQDPGAPFMSSTTPAAKSRRESPSPRGTLGRPRR
jgi:hypothetical protein